MKFGDVSLIMEGCIGTFTPLYIPIPHPVIAYFTVALLFYLTKKLHYFLKLRKTLKKQEK